MKNMIFNVRFRSEVCMEGVSRTHNHGLHFSCARKSQVFNVAMHIRVCCMNAVHAFVLRRELCALLDIIYLYLALPLSPNGRGGQTPYQFLLAEVTFGTVVAGSTPQRCLKMAYIFFVRPLCTSVEAGGA